MRVTHEHKKYSEPLPRHQISEGEYLQILAPIRLEDLQFSAGLRGQCYVTSAVGKHRKTKIVSHLLVWLSAPVV
jgi:hypothetical protein